MVPEGSTAGVVTKSTGKRRFNLFLLHMSTCLCGPCAHACQHMRAPVRASVRAFVRLFVRA